MKNDLMLFVFIIFVLFSLNSSGQQNSTHNLEIAVSNYTDDTLEIMLHPISALFNGDNLYTLVAKYRIISSSNSYNYINGVHYNTDSLVRKNYLLPGNENDPTEGGWNVDVTTVPFLRGSGEWGSFGYGMYKIIIKNLSTSQVDSCLMEFDYTGLQESDLYLKIYNDSNAQHCRFGYRFNWVPNDTFLFPIHYDSLKGYLAVPWEPYSFLDPSLNRSKNFGPSGGFILENFKDTALRFSSNFFPLDSRLNCNFINPPDEFFCVQNHTFPYPYESPPVQFYDERHGLLTLNLTIKKCVETSPYRSIFSIGNPLPTQIVVTPGVTLAVMVMGPKDDPSQNYLYNGIILNKYFNDNTGNELVIKGPNQKYGGGKLLLGDSYNLDSNCRVVVNSYCGLKIESGGILELGKKSRIELDNSSLDSLHKGKLTANNNSNIISHQQSKIFIGKNGIFENYGANIANATNFNFEIWDGGIYDITTENYEHIVDSGAYFYINNGTIKIADNSSLIFDGINSYCEISTNSKILLGQNAKIEFKNGAYFIANGSNISSLPNKQGWGINLENAGEQTVITNCNFSNLTRALYINNTDAGHANLLRNISNNTFTGNENCMMLLGTNNTNAIHVINNNFYMEPNKGFGVFMVFTAGGSGSEAAGASYNLYFQDNDFEDGNLSAAFLSETSSYPFITFKYNTFSGFTNHANLYLRQITGDFKYNTIVNNSGFNFDITQSNPNILSNTMTSPNLNILNTAAYPVMAPVSNSSTDGGWIWKGGKNQITSSYNDNAYFDNGNILLDWGQNCFLKGANKNHLIGGIDESTLEYKVRNNDFNNSNIPVSSLYYYYNINQQVTPYYQGSNFICNSTDMGTVWLINDLGNGIYDTVFNSNNTSGYQPQPDEANYSSATVKMTQNQYFDAISYFKALINNYPASSYTDACLYDLYECYVNLDTSGIQSIRDILFNDLRNYLNSKILSGLYSSEFNSIAYNVTVMCEAYIGDFNEALEGYEFISLYHPDMYIRLLASWDYAEILELLNGPGGISSKEENMTDKEYVSHITKRINKLIAEDPVKKKMKKSFLRMKEDRKTAIEKDILSKTKDEKATKTTIAKLQKDELKMEDRVIKILRYAGTMSEEEKRKQQMEDILLAHYKGNLSDEVSETKIPGSYELSQNYPNPFNPVTKINYALPKQGFVTLKIYDITGREIKVLVNEFRQAGYYTVDFNGSSLASGVYFYRIQSGDFMSVKKMVLVK